MVSAFSSVVSPAKEAEEKELDQMDQDFMILNKEKTYTVSSLVDSSKGPSKASDGVGLQKKNII